MGLVKLNDRGVRSATTFGSVSGGSMTFIKKLTSDGSDDDLSFVDGTDDVVLDDTYKEYLFLLNDIHPETDDQDFGFQANAAGGSGYDETITSTHFSAYSNEAGTDESLAYDGSGNRDSSQDANLQSLSSGTGNGNDECYSGYLHIFNPSSTTFVKHFIARGNHYNSGDYSINNHMAGYFNTTSAIDEIQFKFASGDIDAGKIKLYGLKDSA